MSSKISRLQSELDKLYAAQRDYSTHYGYSKYKMRVDEIKNKGYKVYRNNAGNHVVEKDYKRADGTHNYSENRNVGYKKGLLSSRIASFLGLIFNKKMIALIVVVAAIIIFAKKMNFTKPDKDYFMGIVPDELLYYEYYGNIYKSSVKDIEIVREKTEKKQNEARCIITLGDDKVERKLYVDFYSSKYNNGWNLMSWSEYQEGEASPLVGLPEEVILRQIGSSLPFDHYDDIRDYSNLAEKTIQYEIALSYSSKYRKVSGNAFITGVFEQSHIVNEEYYGYPDESPCNYKYKYGYEYEFDDSNIKFDWYIDGSYGCEKIDILETIELEYPIFSISKQSDGFVINYDYIYHKKEYYSDKEFTEDYSGKCLVENNEIDINDKSFSNVDPFMILPIRIYHLSDELYLRFTDNNVYLGGVELIDLSDE